MSSWIAYARPNPEARMRLFCFPYAGGSAQIFRNWRQHLPANLELCPVELPGRGGRLKEPLYTTVEPLVKDMAQALLPYLDKPFALFGHSMGALLSFELARLLRQEHDLRPVHLFASAHSAPQLGVTYTPRHNLPEDEFIEALHSLNGTPRAVLENPELMQVMVPILRADFAMCETFTYTDGPPLDCSLSVFGGLQDYEMTRDKLEAWREQTSKSFSLRMFPGDHFFINTARTLLLEIIYRVMYEALNGDDGR